MEYRYLGRTGLKISTLTMGTMTFGGKGRFAKVGTTDRKEAQRLVDICLDAGVNLIDTANVYSQGLSEEIVGDVLGGKRKNDVMVCSKVRMKIGEGPNDEGLSRYHIIRECEKSLNRLKTDVIDLYLLHEWDGMTPLEETMAALDTLVQQGKIRYAGCSNYSGWHIMKAQGIAERDRRPRLVAQQIHYTLEARDAEYELLPISIDQGIGVMVWAPIAGGLLTGKFRRDRKAPEGTRHFGGWHEPPIRDENRLWNIIDTLVEIGEARGVSAAQIALAWLLGRPAVTTLVVGGRTEAHFRDNLAAVELTLSAEERERLDKVSKPPVIYPYWHQWNTARGRLGEADQVLDRG